MSQWLASPEVRQAFWTILIGVLSNVSCALVGCYLLLRRMSLLGDAISHSVLPGIVFAYAMTGQLGGIWIIVGAMAVGVLTSLLTETIHSYGRVPEDASMGVAFTSLFALGVVMLNRVAQHADIDPSCVLYGQIETSVLDLENWFGYDVAHAAIPLGITFVATLGFVLLFWKELKVASFDPALATAMGFSSRAIHYLLMAMVAGVTVASFDSVGSILVVAMLIVPAATAHLLTDRLAPMMLWASAVAISSAVIGYFAATRLNTSVAGMMPVAAGAQFFLALLIAPRHGLLVKLLGNLRLSARIAGEDLLTMLYRREELIHSDNRPTTGPAVVPASVAVARLAHAETWRTAGWLIGGLTIVRLVLRGQVRFHQGGLVLTDAGREFAESIVRSHRLWESYLGEHFELPSDHLHEAAERMEHFIGRDLQTELAEQLAQPAVDPHGRSIPPPAHTSSSRKSGN